MPTNQIYIYDGEQGLHCECGNSEPTPEQGEYMTFSVWWDTSQSPSGTMAVCSKCGSGPQRAQVVHRPANATK